MKADGPPSINTSVLSKPTGCWTANPGIFYTTCNKTQPSIHTGRSADGQRQRLQSVLPKPHLVNKSETTGSNDIHKVLRLFFLHYILTWPCSNICTDVLIYGSIRVSNIHSNGQLIFKLMVNDFYHKMWYKIFCNKSIKIPTLKGQKAVNTI